MSTNRISIAGDWSCQLTVKGQMQQHMVKLPGTTAENRVGEPVQIDMEMSKEAIRCLRQHHSYIGEAIYERKICIPEEFEGKRIILFLERVMFRSSVTIDGIAVGSLDSLSVPHSYDVTEQVVPGKEHTLQIVIDNRDVQNIGSNPSAYTEETQSIWNGIVGRMELQAQELLSIRELQVYPQVTEKKIRIKVWIESHLEAEVETVVRACTAREDNWSEPMRCDEYNMLIGTGITVHEFALDMGDEIYLWDEFHPELYQLSLGVKTVEAAIPQVMSSKCVNFGMREFEAVGSEFRINGRRIFLRGTLECCIFPLTGYPPTTLEPWVRIMKTLKEYGLNHLRFHSWCPPEAAFEAADREGIYLQVEAPMWMDTWFDLVVGKYPEHYTYLPEEVLRIVDTYGNHPSFCLFSNGNELNGDFELLSKMTGMLRAHDTRRVYTLTTNWDRPIDAQDQYYVACSVDKKGMRGQYHLEQLAQGTMVEYHDAISQRGVPVVSHEVGQYVVYPDMREIDKYSGVLTPTNLLTIRKDLKKKGLMKDAERFTLGSGRLAFQLYKDDMESILRTQGHSGYQLLDLHDFPGQSTATVGILNAFWESKGIATAAEFRCFCGPVVPLLRMERRIFDQTEMFSADVQIANFSSGILEAAVVRWTILDCNGKEYAVGCFDSMDIPIGNCNPVGRIEGQKFDFVVDAMQLKVVVSIDGTSISNYWDVWVYPKPKELQDRRICTVLDAEVEKRLECGEDVLLVPAPETLENAFEGKFFPVFWSPVHFASINPCGIWCDPTHSVFEQFPTEFHSNYQWKELLEHSSSICLDSMPVTVEPIVQVIPNFFHNHRMTCLFEARVGKGRLMVCSIDIINNLEQRKEAAQLLRSILAYMDGDRFQPKSVLELEVLQKLFKTE